MKKLLLSTGLAASLVAASVTEAAAQGNLAPAARAVSRIDIKNPANAYRNVRQLAPGVSISVVNGKKHLNNLNAPVDNRLNTAPAVNRFMAPAPEGYVLFESFEDWDGEDKNWIPEGWTVEMKGNVGRNESWIPYEPGRWDSPVPDGKFGFKVTWGSDVQDEWLISPYVDVLDDMDLSYWLSMAPMWLFKIDRDHIDFDTNQWIGEPEVAATLQIWAQAEGADWVMLKDYADDYKDYNYRDLAVIMHEGTDIVSLQDYYGKKTRVAFRFVGEDGDEMFIDAVGIGYPTIKDVSYLRPASTQFWGLERSPDMVALAEAIASYPVYEPITWINNNPQPTITYTWTYSDPETKEPVSTTENPEELSVTYVPDYTLGDMGIINFYSSPILKAEATHAVPVEYQAPFGYIQAGGKPERTIRGGVNGTGMIHVDEFTMLPFCLQELDLGMITVDDEAIGDMSIPVFGYNGANTDRYWLNYSLNGAEAKEGDFSHLIAIGNLYIPETGTPLVVRGGNVYGYGQIDDAAELTMTIRAVSAETYDGTYDAMEIVASKTITGARILRQDPSKSYMCIPFDFDEPVVLQATDEIWAYMIMFEGFRSEHVTYFAPLQNKVQESDDYRCTGYIFNYIDLSNHIERPAYHSTKTMRYVENGEYETFNGAFAIGLDAEYPWLKADKDAVTLPADGSTATVDLDSYYDGADLTVETPEGVNAMVAGRYDQCVLILSLAEGASDVSGDVVVKGPGVEVKIAVSGTTGISAITAKEADVKDIYDVAGRQVKAADITPGIYVVKFTDGSTRKLIVK